MTNNVLPKTDERVGDPASPLADPHFLEDLRQQMQRFATSQLADEHLAEDAVQEALIGALKNARTFSGRAALKTWIFAILKNKIADILRKRNRYVEANQLVGEDGGEQDLEELFNERGYWHTAEQPVSWADTESAIHSEHFWRVFETCLDHLPGRQAQVFMMREFIELESREICVAMGITVSNLNVTMHRARLRLRECLENQWFMHGSSS